jgi:hypothetical protein
MPGAGGAAAQVMMRFPRRPEISLLAGHLGDLDPAEPIRKILYSIFVLRSGEGEPSRLAVITLSAARLYELMPIDRTVFLIDRGNERPATDVACDEGSSSPAARASSSARSACFAS